MMGDINIVQNNTLSHRHNPQLTGNRVATGQGKVREIQGQGKVREFCNWSGKFGILRKVREFWNWSGKFDFLMSYTQ